MKNAWILPLLWLAFTGTSWATLTLAQDGGSPYRIVLPTTAIAAERHAADELQHYLEKISGAKIAIVTDAEQPVAHEILLGDNRHFGDIRPIEFAKLGPDGFVLRSDGSRLIIAGGKPRGTLNGVYTFLEEHLGVRWFTPDVEVAPRQNRLDVAAVDELRIPRFENRDICWSEVAHNPDFAARHRLNGDHSNLQEKHGGTGAVYYPWVHTFDALVPAKLYKTHPEYFPLIDGKRKGGYVQRCLSNPDVLRLSIKRVRRWIKEHPEARIISVSQNDTFEYCRCRRCKAIDDAEGSPAGSLLKFVNAVAEAIEPQHPNIRIDTLAYLYTRKAPKTIRPHRNVIIRLCSYECCFGHPIETCPTEENRQFRDDIAAWERIAPSLYIWDYTTNFAGFQQPFPNFDSLQPNIRFFAAHHGKSVYEEGNCTIGGSGEMEPLRTYLLAKLLWNPETDLQKDINEFVYAYYGNVAAKILAYLNIIHRPVREYREHAHILDDTYLICPDTNAMDAAEKILDEAEEIAENDVIRFRVQVARLPVWYVKIATDRVRDADRTDLLGRFVAIARQAGISDVSASMSLRDWARFATDSR